MANREQKDRPASDAQSAVEKAVLSTQGVSRLIEKQPITKGVLITNLFGKVEIEIYVNVVYGCNIPEVSWNIQERVKDTLAESSALEPSHINIHIEGVDL